MAHPRREFALLPFFHWYQRLPDNLPRKALPPGCFGSLENSPLRAFCPQGFPASFFFVVRSTSVMVPQSGLATAITFPEGCMSKRLLEDPPKEGKVTPKIQIIATLRQKKCFRRIFRFISFSGCDPKDAQFTHHPFVPLQPIFGALRGSHKGKIRGIFLHDFGLGVKMNGVW